MERSHDRVVVPGGNLGNSSSFGKAIKELYDQGFIVKMPMVTIIQAARANPLYRTLIYQSPRLIPMEATRCDRHQDRESGVLEEGSTSHGLDPRLVRRGE